MENFKGTTGVFPGEFSQDCALLCIDEGDTTPVVASDNMAELSPPGCCVERKTPPVNGRSLLRDLTVVETDSRGFSRPDCNVSRMAKKFPQSNQQ